MMMLTSARSASTRGKLFLKTSLTPIPSRVDGESQEDARDDHTHLDQSALHSAIPVKSDLASLSHLTSRDSAARPAC